MLQFLFISFINYISFDNRYERIKQQVITIILHTFLGLNMINNVILQFCICDIIQ